MSCESYQEDFLDFRAGHLDPARLQQISEHLRTCLTCQRAWADFQELDRKLEELPEPVPSENLRRHFYAMLDTHLAARKEPGVFAPARRGLARLFADWMPSSHLAQAAGFAVFGTALALGALWWQARQERAADLVALRRQVDAVTRLVATTALDREPASARVRTMLTANTADSTGLARLINALALDPNVNVRLSALDSLYTRADQPEVRAAVLTALAREPSPIVQVAMIDFLAATRAPEAQSQFERLSRDPDANSTVRAAATRGLAQLL